MCTAALCSFRKRRLCCAEADPAGGSAATSEGFRNYIQEAFGARDTALQPRSVLLSTFQQRLQALDVPQPLSAVVSHGSWPPTHSISRHATTVQLAMPMSLTGSGGSRIVRKRKGYSSPSGRGCAARKAKAQGALMSVLHVR